MNRLIWAFGWAGVGIWSLVCWAAYALFDFLGGVLKRNAGAVSSDPEAVQWIWAILNFLHGLSTTAVLIAWAIVSLLILAVPWLIDRMLAPPRGGGSVRPTGRMSFGEGRPGRPVIDLEPDQYEVRPGAGSPPPTGPRVLPRS